jgi:hypothetical protein
MPTVLRIGAVRVVIYPNDHRPAHIHVIGSGEAVFVLHCPDGPPELRESYGFNASEVRRLAGVLADHVATLCSAWGEIHGRH